MSHLVQTTDIEIARSMLFVPATRPDRFVKAMTSGADAIVLDLEDAVGAGEKSSARTNVSEWLAGGGGGIVRINAPGSPWFDDDLSIIQHPGIGVMVPKVDEPDALMALRSKLPEEAFLIPILESASGILNAWAICSVPGVVRAIFGNGDLGAQLGVHHADEHALLHAKSALVLSSAAAGIAPPLDGVTTVLDSDSSTRAAAAHAARLGFGGKMCIHPRQVPLVNDAFTPSESEVAWARRIIDDAPDDGSAVAIGNEMVDMPVVTRARRVLRRAHAHASDEER